MRPHDLLGTFVVEIGIRQAWPFVGFCDNRSDPSAEFRLYVDTIWRVDDRGPAGADVTEGWPEQAGELNGLTVETITAQPDGSLEIGLEKHHVWLSGTARGETSGAPWWLSPISSVSGS